ncbi:MAG: inorganic phosphate transporter [Planctomycetota bacterium]|nr:inorganic phosphate transporter [Planctomycetota bacterium]
MTFVLLTFVALLAFANGANDTCKGVATLVGFGTATPRQALLWATATTALGAGASYWFAGGLVKSFSTGLFAAGTTLDHPFFLAVLVGASAWVIFATLTGLPVSTTHAIIGALTGAGLVSFGSARFEWGFLGAKFAFPLALSPFLSMAAVYIVAWPVSLAAGRLLGKCVCVTQPAAGCAEPAPAPASRAGAGTATMTSAAAIPLVVVASERECAAEPMAATATGSMAADSLHWTSSGMVGFARGWNDAPKIAALSLVALSGPNGMATGFAIVTVAMALGGLIAGRKVLETLAKKVTAMPLAESLAASLTTAALVGMASWKSLPVSTTHVSTGAIIGAGLKHDARAVKWRKVGEIAVSWVVTLPVAALVAAGMKMLLR